MSSHDVVSRAQSNNQWDEAEIKWRPHIWRCVDVDRFLQFFKRMMRVRIWKFRYDVIRDLMTPVSGFRLLFKFSSLHWILSGAEIQYYFFGTFKLKQRKDWQCYSTKRTRHRACSDRRGWPSGPQFLHSGNEISTLTT